MPRYAGTAAIAVASVLLLMTPVWAPAQEEGGAAQPAVLASATHQPKSAMRGAARAEELRHKLRDQANKGLVGIISEGTDETTGMAFVLASEAEGVRLLPIAGSGAAQNVIDVIFARGIDLGIIQTDVLDEIKRNPPFPGVTKYVQYVTKLYDQQVHILAGPDIRSIHDLQGKKVNFGRPDGGTYVTGTNLFKAIGVQPIVTTLPHPVALDQLRRGEISAMVYLATKPSRMFQDIRPDEKMHFLAVTGNIPKDYTQTTIDSNDYPELVSQIAPVTTVAVGTVLVAYNWPVISERHARVNRFIQAFFTHLDDIKALHPRWHAFDVVSEVSGWTRSPGAERWLKKAELVTDPHHAVAQLAPNQHEELFRAFVDYQKHAAAELDPNHREELFRAFANYEKLHREVVALRDANVQ
jgi:uncharacterized protein